MIVRNASRDDLDAALRKTNDKYGGNVVWKSIKPVGKNYNFTLKVRSSKGDGARRGFSGRRMASACWHVHGDFFDNLFGVAPNAVVVSMGKKITKDFGNWEDRNIGSVVNPLYYSDACDCEK